MVANASSITSYWSHVSTHTPGAKCHHQGRNSKSAQALMQQQQWRQEQQQQSMQVMVWQQKSACRTALKQCHFTDPSVVIGSLLAP